MSDFPLIKLEIDHMRHAIITHFKHISKRSEQGSQVYEVAMVEERSIGIYRKIANDILNNSIDIPPELAKLINDCFWDIV